MCVSRSSARPGRADQEQVEVIRNLLPARLCGSLKPLQLAQQLNVWFQLAKMHSAGTDVDAGPGLPGGSADTDADAGPALRADADAGPSPLPVRGKWR
jgi:hypothetical protein